VKNARAAAGISRGQKSKSLYPATFAWEGVGSIAAKARLSTAYVATTEDHAGQLAHAATGLAILQSSRLGGWIDGVGVHTDQDAAWSSAVDVS
jgi:hypothetical protein